MFPNIYIEVCTLLPASANSVSHPRLPGSVWIFELNVCTGGATPTTSTPPCTNVTLGIEHLFLSRRRSSTNVYCHKELYDVAYYVTLAKWIVMAALLVIGLIFCCVIVCVEMINPSETEAEPTDATTNETSMNQAWFYSFYEFNWNIIINHLIWCLLCHCHLLQFTCLHSSWCVSTI